MPIVISKNKQNAQQIEKTKFSGENELQKYIYDNPESLPMNDIKEDIHLLILAREFSTNSGPIDALGIDRDGEIYIIETKLYKNPDKRQVVGQILDYGSSLWNSYGDFGEFRSAIDQKVNQHLGMNLNQKLEDFFGLNDDDVQSLLEDVQTNLSGGKFRFVVLMDQLHDQLKDLIVFINQNSKFDIFGVEMEYYKFQDYEIIIPKVFGAEVKKEVSSKRGGGGRRKWNEETFFKSIQEGLDSETGSAVRRIYDFCLENADDITWGSGNSGSFNPKFNNISKRSIFGVSGLGGVQINFGWLNDNEVALEVRENLKMELERIDFMKLPDDFKEKFPTTSLKDVLPKLNDFLEVIDNLIKAGR